MIDFTPEATFSFSYRDKEVPATFDDEWKGFVDQVLLSDLKNQDTMPIQERVISGNSIRVDAFRQKLNFPLKKFLLPTDQSNETETIKVFKSLKRDGVTYSFANKELDREINLVYSDQPGKLVRIELKDSQYKPDLSESNLKNNAERNLIINFDNDGLIDHITDDRQIKEFGGKPGNHGISYRYFRNGDILQAEVVAKMDKDSNWNILKKPISIDRANSFGSPVKSEFTALKFDRSFLGLSVGKFAAPKKI